jgi:hypothetical protein
MRLKPVLDLGYDDDIAKMLTKEIKELAGKCQKRNQRDLSDTDLDICSRESPVNPIYRQSPG